jgi:hypothetical protein
VRTPGLSQSARPFDGQAFSWWCPAATAKKPGFGFEELLGVALLSRSDKSSQTAAVGEESVSAPPAGAYLTDGTTLFYVEHSLSDTANGELFLELEDCVTSDVVLCPARAVMAMGLRAVTPQIALRDDRVQVGR